MFAYDYEAVVYGPDIFCVECLPEGVDTEDEEVEPIFAASEWYSAPICCQCGVVHEYMTILDEEGGTDDAA